MRLSLLARVAVVTLPPEELIERSEPPSTQSVKETWSLPLGLVDWLVSEAWVRVGDFDVGGMLAMIEKVILLLWSLF